MGRHFAGGGYAYRPTGSTGDLRFPGPASAAPEGNLSAPYSPFRRWRLRLTRPGFVRPVTHLPTCATETAGAGGLKIAETFPEGRGSPHGCGLRAVFAGTLPRPDPQPAGISRRYHAVAMLLAGARGYRGGDWPPLCAPCAIRDITQKINRERNLPGINIEVVALPNIVRTVTFPVVPLFRRVAATPYPAYGVYRRSSLPRPGKRCAGGQSIGAIPAISPVAAAPYPAYGSTGDLRFPGPASAAPPGTHRRVPAILPGGGYALPGLQQLPGNPTRTTT